MASSAASSKRKRQYACGSIDDCGDPLDDNAMSLRALANTHNRPDSLRCSSHTQNTLLSPLFLSLGRVKVVTTRDERELFFVFFVFFVLFFVFFCARLFLFFFCVSF